MNTLPSVAVIGAGTMGHGIAYVAALAGCRVALADADPSRLTQVMRQIEGAFARGIDRGRVTAEARDAALARLTAAGSTREAVRDADVMIEAVPEQLELKRQLFTEVERHARPGALLASNTSSLSISEIARDLQHPERMLGMHFFNPVPAMRLLEVVRGEVTSDGAVARACDLGRLLGKEPIVVRDAPGFATSRLGVVLGLEAIRMLEQGVASAEDIDRAMQLGYNHPMGPLRLTDVVGLDIRLAIAEHLHDALKDETYRPPALLREKVQRGELGKKSGQGFYHWESER